ncbi:hypothetical protein VF14_32610 [Nostoc linckia z18]|uniref:Uncharacterized protein n=2 Tax=Nostoc linckia TaxID=92942 RepID=A0A9Q5Z7Q0_NOSLI|nr:hypothetical protein [Nostoc linckia]PHK33589.1 hypothetical protein VF12_25035 [Nostoc linckia z15]PHK44571.1 hypothetical protein VF13_21445 [Nostoc linckia z16]PHJ59615.1 hypothetical protein VF02_24720 [Nostoc linckia z1]PHJ59907.1 hypothetical protein VF03_33950 [Nostoc linckia z2]PHJ65107.1 hypothetical protein VF05_21430 [Nostoc linckia z3]
MKVIIRVQETVTKDAEIEIPDDTEDPKQYCLTLYNENALESELEVSDSTCSSFEVEVVEPKL